MRKTIEEKESERDRLIYLGKEGIEGGKEMEGKVEVQKKVREENGIERG